MLRHSIESIEHGFVHYLDGTDVGHKFALLHLDHGIELAVKERVVRQGISIYQKDGKTIGFHQALNHLPAGSVPERPRLEDLHDFRNIVQHKGLTPDENTTDFYVREAYAFIRRFFQDGLGIDIVGLLPRAQVVALESPEALTAYDTEGRLADAYRLLAIGQLDMAIVSAYASVEATIRETIPGSGWSSSDTIATAIIADDPELQKRFLRARDLRNNAAHSAAPVSLSDAEFAIDTLKTIVDRLLANRKKAT